MDHSDNGGIPTAIRLSTLQTLTISDLIKYNHLTWDRASMGSPHLVDNREEVDRLAAAKVINVGGSWYKFNPSLTPSRKMIKNIQTIDDYFTYEKSLSPFERTCFQAHLSQTLPYEALLNDDRWTFPLTSLPLRPSLTPEIIERLQVKFPRQLWLTNYTNVSVELMSQCPNFPWNRHGMKHDGPLSFNFIQKLERPTNLKVVGEFGIYNLSRLIILSPELVTSPAFSEGSYYWDRSGLSCNKSITLEIMRLIDDHVNQNNFVRNWNWRLLTRYIKLEDILDKIDRFSDDETEETASGWHISSLFQRSTSDIETIFTHIHHLPKKRRIHREVLDRLLSSLRPEMISRYLLIYPNDPGLIELADRPLITIGSLHYLLSDDEKLEINLLPLTIPKLLSSPWTDLVVVTI
jgi:hypothetical protein